jgi:porphyrinogen peroxidase
MIYGARSDDNQGCGYRPIGRHCAVLIGLRRKAVLDLADADRAHLEGVRDRPCRLLLQRVDRAVPERGTVGSATLTGSGQLLRGAHKIRHSPGRFNDRSGQLTTSDAKNGPPPVPQAVVQPLTRAAIFLVVTVHPGVENRAAVRSFCGDLSALLRAVGFRDIEGNLSCVLGFGSDAWDKLFGMPRPAELHPFREIRAGPRHAVATPGDLLFHIRAKRMDLCFELATQIMARLRDTVSPVDEVHGFRYFDDRDLIGFVDGTENPTDQAAIDATLVSLEDAAFAGGSYVIVQKYLHDLAGWNALSTEAQERIIGRTKLSDIELDDAVKPTCAHNALTTIVEDGKEVKILRDNMPFGSAAQAEFGTYFIGYARSPRPIEQMLVNMFVGRPAGNYDRLLDFSRAVSGSLFFAPSATFLESIGDDEPAVTMPPAAVAAPTRPAASVHDGSLGIGSLKGDPSHE